MGKQKHYQVLLTEEQAEQLRYVCEDMSEPYSDMAYVEEKGGSPFVDRPGASFLTNVSETLDFAHLMLETPVYEGELPLLVMDADQKIHYLNVLADYHGYLVEFIGERIGDKASKEEIDLDLYSLYLLGNIEGRLLYNGVTEGDMKLLEEWDEFLQGMKKEAEEQEKVVVLDLDKWYACPHCGKSCEGNELQYPIAGGILYVCPACGCIQEEKEVERQLGTEE